MTIIFSISPRTRTLQHLNFICLDSFPTLRRTLSNLPCLAKFNSAGTRSFATPSLCCRELIYLNIYATRSIRSNSGFLIRSVWCWNNFFFLRPLAPVHKCFHRQPPVTKRKFCTFRMQAITKWNLKWKKFRFKPTGAVFIFVYRFYLRFSCERGPTRD